MSAIVYEGQDISAGYGDKIVISRCTFTVEQGVCLALIGPNGAGKTTLLRLLAGDIDVRSGCLSLDQRPLSAHDLRHRAQRIAFVPSMLDLHTRLSIYEFVALGRTPYLRGWPRLRRTDREAVAKALDHMELGGFEARDMQSLSEGEKHRAMIALALAQEPEILLLDEPTAHLDIKHAWTTLELILRLQQSQPRPLTIVLAAHDLHLTANFCTHFILMQEGRIRQQGPAASVLSSDRLSAVYGYPIHVEQAPDQNQYRIFPLKR